LASRIQKPQYLIERTFPDGLALPINAAKSGGTALRLARRATRV
jgi:hypothetical protein